MIGKPLPKEKQIGNPIRLVAIIRIKKINPTLAAWDFMCF
jgi:hypothetical protein